MIRDPEIFKCKCCGTPINSVVKYRCGRGYRFRIDYEKRYCDNTCARFYSSRGYRRPRDLNEPRLTKVKTVG